MWKETLAEGTYRGEYYTVTALKILSLTNYRFKVSFHFKDNSNNFCISANCCCLHTSPYISHLITLVTYELNILQSVFSKRAQQDKDPQ